MADLLDIAPAAAVAVVEIDGKPITVRSLSFNAAASIIVRFPALRVLIKEGLDDDLVPHLILGCGASVGPIIAAGCGHFAEEAYEQVAANLSLPQQVKFLKAILGLSFPNGIGPFAAEMSDLISIIQGPSEGAKPIKMRSRNSRSESPPSSDEASHQTMQ